MVECSNIFMKCLVCFFNLLFWISGWGLIYIGTVVRNRYGDYVSYADSSFVIIAICLIAVGAVIVLVGFIGCCAAFKEDTGMIKKFLCIIGIISISQIVIGSIGFVYKNKVEEKASDAITLAVENYYIKPEAKNLMDWAQPLFKCCGSKTTTYLYHTGNSTCDDNTPYSCHPDKDCNAANYYRKCESGFIQFIKDNLDLISAFPIVASLVQIPVFLYGCCFLRMNGEYQKIEDTKCVSCTTRENAPSVYNFHVDNLQINNYNSDSVNDQQSLRDFAHRFIQSARVDTLAISE